jgi:hypothetical protein
MVKGMARGRTVTMDEDFFQEMKRQGPPRPPMPMRSSRLKFNDDAAFETSIKYTGRGIVWLFLLPAIGLVLIMLWKLFSPMVQPIIESFQK